MAVYFLAYEHENIVKIGVAEDDTRSRVRGIAHMSPVPLTLLGWGEGGRDLEQRLHREHDADRCHGEWFRRTPLVNATIRRYAVHQEDWLLGLSELLPGSGRRRKPHTPTPGVHPATTPWTRGTAVLSLNEACDTLRISRATAYRRIADGTLSVRRLGRRTLVPASEITRIVAAET